jgi:uncharacterized protein (UPF0147 family)
MAKIHEAFALLEEVLNDRGVPRNIKGAIEDSINEMKSSTENDDVKLSTIVSVLDDSTNDPNLSLYARTKIWDIVSKLEELNKK